MKLAKYVEKWDGLLYAAYNVCAQLKFTCLDQFKYGKLLKKTKELKNKHRGERCFVVMNGPSLNQYDLTPLKNETVFCANFFYRSSVTETVDPNYYCWTDKKAFYDVGGDQILEDIRAKCPNSKQIFTTRIYEQVGEQDGVYYAYCKHMPNVFGIRCSLDRLSSNFVNVALYTINAAIYMGFSEIYVLGMDFTPGGFKHFQDLGPGCEPTEPKEKKEDVCGSYFEYTKAHYEAYVLSDFAKKKNVKVVNLNPNSYMRAFSFGSYDALFGEKR